ncbi:hypothetical protein [Terricaulis sp.]|uniref:hypothetical protein n=1 Tax=Terricaulis sp. TaxID=2768686 RepID=UPI0037843464
MKRVLAALAFAALAACTPAPNTGGADGAKAAVESVYATAQRNLGHVVTSFDEIPFTDDMKGLLARAEAAATQRGEPFIEGDVALNCQDCFTVTDLVIGPQTGPQREPAIDGHTWVEAKFKLNDDEERTVLWDMVETPQGWRVDNVLSDGLNLRTEAQSYLTDTNPPPP